MVHQHVIGFNVKPKERKKFIHVYTRHVHADEVYKYDELCLDCSDDPITPNMIDKIAEREWQIAPRNYVAMWVVKYKSIK